MSSAVNMPALSLQARPWYRPRLFRSDGGAGDAYLLMLAAGLMCYALLGRGFAYLGLPPIYFGELLVMLGLCVTLTGRGLSALHTAAGWALLAFCSWGALRVLPDVQMYGLEALRDAVIWGYAAMAFVVAALLSRRPERLARTVRFYGAFAAVFSVAAPLMWVLLREWENAPSWPGVNVPMPHMKGGDVLVHLAGVTAFWGLGVGGCTSERTQRWLWPMLALGIAIVGVASRAGMLALLAAGSLAIMLRPRSPLWWRLVAAWIIGLTLLGTTGSVIDLKFKGRELSFSQIVENFRSIAGDSDKGNLEGTREFRMNWWRDIVGYTFGGKYFLTGKGFGFSLADSDGYQVLEDGSLRSPHNGHMTILARMGVPGITLWAATQTAWASSVLLTWLQARRAGRRRWSRLLAFLGVYWTAFLVNATFDVYLEGPMGGIWFWCVFGWGLATVLVYRRAPEVLVDAPSEPGRVASYSDREIGATRPGSLGGVA